MPTPFAGRMPARMNLAFPPFSVSTLSRELLPIAVASPSRLSFANSTILKRGAERYGERDRAGKREEKKSEIKANRRGKRKKKTTSLQTNYHGVDRPFKKKKIRNIIRGRGGSEKNKEKQKVTTSSNSFGSTYSIDFF